MQPGAEDLVRRAHDLRLDVPARARRAVVLAPPTPAPLSRDLGAGDRRQRRLAEVPGPDPGDGPARRGVRPPDRGPRRRSRARPLGHPPGPGRMGDPPAHRSDLQLHRACPRHLRGTSDACREAARRRVRGDDLGLQPTTADRLVRQARRPGRGDPLRRRRGRLPAQARARRRRTARGPPLRGARGGHAAAAEGPRGPGRGDATAGRSRRRGPRPDRRRGRGASEPRGGHRRGRPDRAGPAPRPAAARSGRGAPRRGRCRGPAEHRAAERQDRGHPGRADGGPRQPGAGRRDRRVRRSGARRGWRDRPPGPARRRSRRSPTHWPTCSATRAAPPGWPMPVTLGSWPSSTCGRTRAAWPSASSPWRRRPAAMCRRWPPRPTIRPRRPRRRAGAASGRWAMPRSAARTGRSAREPRRPGVAARIP